MTDDDTTDDVEAPSTNDLAVGDRFEIGGKAIIILGVTPASEAPEADDSGPLYEAKVWGDDGQMRTLYRPHHIANGLAAGAEYTGNVNVEEERVAEPFWCAGCDLPTLDDDQHDAPLVEEDVCSYGCGMIVEEERRVEKMEDRR